MCVCVLKSVSQCGNHESPTSSLTTRAGARVLHDLVYASHARLLSIVGSASVCGYTDKPTTDREPG